VPAVFTLLDDLGSLSWRLFSRVLSLEGDKEGPATEQAARDAAPAH
jgi:hypothetical protein